MRKVAYITGTRADFGLMESTLAGLNRHPDIDLQLLVTGMHLDPACGLTVRDIEATGLPIRARVAVDMSQRTPAHMSLGLANMLSGLTTALDSLRPDIVVVLGDRGEMLAGALAALHLGLPCAHLHGGERSGTIDDSVRHAITKLSHWHLVATRQSHERVLRMGELPEHVWQVGAPGLDGIAGKANQPMEKVLQALGLQADDRYILVVFHPVVQEYVSTAEQTRCLSNAVRESAQLQGVKVVWFDPNTDAGSSEILGSLQHGLFKRVTHLPRNIYLAALANACMLVGNSSSGIIEAASFGVPVVNVGNRQRARQRNQNVFDTDNSESGIKLAISAAYSHGRFAKNNVYGDGFAGERIVQLLAHGELPASLLDKSNAY